MTSSPCDEEQAKLRKPHKITLEIMEGDIGILFASAALCSVIEDKTALMGKVFPKNIGEHWKKWTLGGYKEDENHAICMKAYMHGLLMFADHIAGQLFQATHDIDGKNKFKSGSVPAVIKTFAITKLMKMVGFMDKLADKIEEN